MKKQNPKTGVYSVIAIVISLVSVLLLLVPDWVSFSEESISVFEYLKFADSDLLAAIGAPMQTLSAIKVLMVIAFIAGIISAVTLVIYAILAKKRSPKVRTLGRAAYVLLMVSSLCAFFIIALGNYFLNTTLGTADLAFFSVNAWPVIAFVIGFVMVFFYIPNMRIELKENEEAPKKIVADGFYSSVSVMEEKAINAIERNRSKEETEDEKAEAKAKKQAEKDVMKRLMSYLKPSAKGLIVSVITIIIAQVAFGIAPFIMGKCTDGIINMAKAGWGSPQWETFSNTFRINLLILIIFYIAYTIFDFIGQYVLADVTEKTLYNLRAEMDAKICRIPLNYFDTNSFGDILSRVTNDIDAIAVTLQQSIYTVVKAVTLVICMTIMMLKINLALTGIGVLIIPATMLISTLIIKKANKHFVRKQELIGIINGHVEEMYEGHNIIKAFGRESDVGAEFDAFNEELEKTSIKAEFAGASLMSVSMSLTNISYAVVAAMAGLMALSGQLQVGMIQSFLQYLQSFGEPINETSQISGMLQSTAAAANRVFEFIDEKEEVPDPADPIALGKVKGEVVFDHVQFGYVPGRILVHDLSAKVAPGSKVGVVGPTGAGKSTLINLLMRFYEVNGGSISVDGVKTTDMTRRELRSHFGMVLQDPWLFKGTILENLRYGKLGCSDETVYEAAKAAHCDEFIRQLPGGYQFELSENGSNLSQGQRQLLTIARAFVADPEMLILDEATSSVDTRTEKTIQSAMVNLMKGRTSFVIAHRLSTIKDSQLILYMQNGDILEQGTHEELMAKDGLYAKLYNSQFA